MEAKQEYSKVPISTIEVEVMRPQYRVEHGSIVITEVDRNSDGIGRYSSSRDFSVEVVPNEVGSISRETSSGYNWSNSTSEFRNSSSVPYTLKIPVRDEEGKIVYKKEKLVFQGRGEGIIAGYREVPVKEDRLNLYKWPPVKSIEVERYKEPIVKFVHGVDFVGKTLYNATLGAAIGGAVGGVLGAVLSAVS
ncbi:MAG: hypothetical protein RMJ36_04280 [Candidatus Calescibacterium sp.]|nr:hypothetical protein [Candidatus Calescibacterium sp.]MDW8132854.1 hypothetical protein [Candidatus Calescibacterium sp.]